MVGGPLLGGASRGAMIWKGSECEDPAFSLGMEAQRQGREFGQPQVLHSMTFTDGSFLLHKMCFESKKNFADIPK